MSTESCKPTAARMRSQRPLTLALSVRFFTPISPSSYPTSLRRVNRSSKHAFLVLSKQRGGDMIEFVTVENVNQFVDNPPAAQHRLRYRSIIERQQWDVPNY